MKTQPPPQALRFSHGERETRVTGEPQGTMGRVDLPDVSPVVPFPPSFARTFSSKERCLGTRQVKTDSLPCAQVPFSVR